MYFCIKWDLHLFLIDDSKNREIKPYESMEWQAKALAGEIMMPYEDTANMSVKDIMNIYGVSKGFAKTGQNY